VKKLFVLLIVLLLALSACSGDSAPEPQPDTAPAAEESSAEESSAVEEKALEDLNIVVSMKGPGGGNPFWASVEKGATDKGAELGVNVNVMAPPAESDVAAPN
jgi:ribose transport system substrate-binding protein